MGGDAAPEHQWGESDSQYLDNLAGIFQSGGEGV